MPDGWIGEKKMRCPKCNAVVTKGGKSVSYSNNGKTITKKDRFYCRKCNKYMINPIKD